MVCHDRQSLLVAMSFCARDFGTYAPLIFTVDICLGNYGTETMLSESTHITWEMNVYPVLHLAVGCQRRVEQIKVMK